MIKSRRMRWVVRVVRTGGREARKRPLEKPRRRWKNNIKMDLQEVGCEGVDWIEVAKDRGRWRALVNEVISLQVP
jgi:hypothetical protein